MVELAKKNENLVAITAAMPDGTGLGKFMKAFPDRFIDVGIAEQHAVTMGAGLAAEGIKPVFAVYSTFLQRAYDQIIHDVCIQNLPVVFAIDRAGLVGNDGETHHGVFDLSFLSHIPNMTVLAPKDGPELSKMLEYAVEKHDGPIAIRYPRGSAGQITEASSDVLTPEILCEGSDVAILAVGNMVSVALKTADILKENGIQASVVNMKCVYPVQKEKLSELVGKLNAKYIVTMEDNVLESGFGSSITSWACEEGLDLDIQSLGIPNKFVEHGNVDKLMVSIGLDPGSVAKRIQLKLKFRRRQK